MEKLLGSLLGSWKTSLLGWFVGANMLIGQIIALLDGDPATVVESTMVFEGLAILGIGTFAKDGDKRSEDVGL